MTIGQRISHNAKAIAALLTAVVTTITAILATVPADIIPAQGAVWIAVALGYATSASVWLTANGPTIGESVDDLTEAVDPIVDDFRDQIDG